MKLGYARVSTADQKMDGQTDLLKLHGAEKIFWDKLSGVKHDRDGLDAMLQMAREGDCVIVWRLDRLARSLKHLMELAALLGERGVALISITENIDTTTPSGKLFFHIFGALAEFERNLIIERTRAGLDAAKSRGRSGGRKPVLTPAKKAALDSLLKDSADFHAHAETLSVSERTVRRYAAGEYVNKASTAAEA